MYFGTYKTLCLNQQTSESSQVLHMLRISFWNPTDNLLCVHFCHFCVSKPPRRCEVYVLYQCFMKYFIKKTHIAFSLFGVTSSNVHSALGYDPGIVWICSFLGGWYVSVKYQVSSRVSLFRHPSSSEALGVEQIGHRLLLARGILALEQQWGEPGCHGNRKKNMGILGDNLETQGVWVEEDLVSNWRCTSPKTDMTIENPHFQ